MNFRRWMKNSVYIHIMIITITCVFLLPSPSSYCGKALTITRDDKGVWFIKGSAEASFYDVFKAMGYAVATDRLWQAEKYRRIGRGRLSAIFGPEYKSADTHFRIRGYSDEELRTAFEVLSSESQEIVNGYVAGFNQRIIEIRDDITLLPAEFIEIGNRLKRPFIPELWDYKDTLSWMAVLQRSFDPEFSRITQIENVALFTKLYKKYGAETASKMFDDLRVTQDPSAHTYFSDMKNEKNKRYSNINISGKQRMSDLSSFDTFEMAALNMKTQGEDYKKKLDDINSFVKMGSYAWVVSGDYTASHQPILYSGPQMGFYTPSICLEGSIQAGGLNISGMTVPGIPAIIIGRTPHHAWSMQVGHAHTTDFYIESIEDVVLDRMETITVAGGPDLNIPIYKTKHGPVIYPPDFDLNTFDSSSGTPIISLKYAHVGYEFNIPKAYLKLALANSMDQFGDAIENIGVSQHFCYADRDGNIAYWMSGRDPVRPPGEWRLPQGIYGVGTALEWDAEKLIPRSTHRNTTKGFYGGWNNKSNPDYPSGFNNVSYLFGPAHRTHVIEDFLSQHIRSNKKLRFEDIRDLALDISTTDSFLGGGNLWNFVREYFISAVEKSAENEKYEAAVEILEAWDGHFVTGDKEEWAVDRNLSDAFILQRAWIQEVMKEIFSDIELKDELSYVLFNVLIRAFAGEKAAVPNRYDWFSHLKNKKNPRTVDGIIVTALDKVLKQLGEKPWGIKKRKTIDYQHELFSEIRHQMPFATRSTYAHCVAYSKNGPSRIESMFPLGQSGDIRMDSNQSPIVHKHFFSMAKDDDGEPILYDLFKLRPFSPCDED